MLQTRLLPIIVSPDATIARSLQLSLERKVDRAAQSWPHSDAMLLLGKDRIVRNLIIGSAVCSLKTINELARILDHIGVGDDRFDLLGVKPGRQIRGIEDSSEPIVTRTRGAASPRSTSAANFPSLANTGATAQPNAVLAATKVRTISGRVNSCVQNRISARRMTEHSGAGDIDRGRTPRYAA